MARRRRAEAPASFFSFQDIMMSTIGVIVIVALVLVLHVARAAAQGLAAASATAAAVDVAALRRERDELAALQSRLGAAADAASERARQRAALRTLNEQLEAERRRVETMHEALRALAEESPQRAQALDVLELIRLREELEAELAEGRRRSRVVYLVDDPERAPIILELGAGRIVVSSTDPDEAPLALDAADPARQAELALSILRSHPDLGSRYPLLVVKPSGMAAFRLLQQAIDADPRLRELGLGVDLIAEEQSTTDEFPPAVADDPPKGRRSP